MTLRGRLLVAIALLLGASSVPGSESLRSGGGGGSGVPGLVGDVCDDPCLEHLEGADSLGGSIPKSAYQRVWYFSAYRGQDYFFGTRDNPLRDDFSRCEEAGTRCVLLEDGSVWSANQLSFDASPSSLSAFPVGSTVTWDDEGDGCPGDETGTVIGLDVELGIVSVRRADATETAPAAADELCSEDDATELTISATEDTSASFELSLDLSKSACDRSDAPCYWIEGEGGGHQALVDFDWEQLNGNPIILVDDDLSNVGSVFLQNLHISRPVEIPLQVGSSDSNGGVVYGHNLILHSANESGDDDNTALTTRGAGWVTITGKKSLANNTSFGVAHTIHIGPEATANTIGGLNWLSSGPIKMEPTQTGTGPLVLGWDGGDGRIIGAPIYRETTGNANLVSIGVDTTSGDEDFSYYFAKSSLWGQYAANRNVLNVTPANTDGTLTLRLYEASLSGHNCLRASTSGAPMDILGRGIVLDQCTAFSVVLGSPNDTVLDLEGVYDPDDGGSLCFIGGVLDTLAACHSALSSGSFFQSNSTDSVSGSLDDGIAWSEDDYPTLSGFNVATPGWVAASGSMPAELNCSGCDFASAGFSPGLIGFTGTGSNDNARVFRVQTVAATKLTFADGEVVTASDGGTATAWQFTYPQLAVHPDHPAFGESIDPYTIPLSTRIPGGTIPAWYTEAGQEIRSFRFEGVVGGR